MKKDVAGWWKSESRKNYKPSNYLRMHSSLPDSRALYIQCLWRLSKGWNKKELYFWPFSVFMFMWYQKKEKIRVLFPFGTIKYPLLRLMTRHKNNNRGNNWKQTWKVYSFSQKIEDIKKKSWNFSMFQVLITHSGKVFIFVNFDSELKFDFSSWRTRRSTERNFQRMRHTAG